MRTLLLLTAAAVLALPAHHALTHCLRSSPALTAAAAFVLFLQAVGTTTYLLTRPGKPAPEAE